MVEMGFLMRVRFCLQDNGYENIMCGLIVSMLIGNFQKLFLQVGPVALCDFIFCGALRIPNFDFQGENPMYDLHWLYLW
jgi:hypothetical protein